MRVGYLSAMDYTSRRAFSGVLHAMRQALRERPGVTVVDLGPAAERGPGRRLARKLGLARDPADLLTPAARGAFARQVTAQLRRAPVDVLFAPVASLELTALDARVDHLPVVYSSDATYRLLDPSYELGTDDPAEAELREASEVSSIRQATRLLYPSRWAAASAVSDYGAAWERIDLAPFGACFDDPPAAIHVDHVRPPRPDWVRLLFVGRGYARKGGAIALDTVRSLRARGIPAELTMIGSTPPEPVEGVTAIEYVDKDDPEQAAYLEQLYADAHFLLFPTRADCSPISLCEAAAYGLPALATDLAGIPDILQGDWGDLLPFEAGGAEYADRIAALIADPDRYTAMATAARRAYDERLNWSAWARAAEVSLGRAVGQA